jgi:hypothetical protein
LPGPRKVINVISAISNGAGLERDTNILCDVLESQGHKWRKIAYDRPFDGLSYHSDINMFLEVMVPGLLPFAPVNYLVPNSEWYEASSTEGVLPRITMALCKTHDCETIWGRKLGRTFYTGFEALDFNANVSIMDKKPEFLHLAGNSGTKNTDAVINCWRMYDPGYPITIVSRDPAVRVQCHGVKNVIYEQRVDDGRVVHMLNNFRFHLMPSEYEGYGQGIHEALGCGGIVLTTNAPPMTEFPGIPAELMIPSFSTHIRRLATCHMVTPAGVLQSVQKAVALPELRLMQFSQAARAGFESEKSAFRERIARLLNS